MSNSFFISTVMTSGCSYWIFYTEHMCIQMELSMILQICHSYSILRSYRSEYIILSFLKLESSGLFHFWYSIWASQLYIPALFRVLCFQTLVLVLCYNQVEVLIIRVTTQLWLIVGWFGPTVWDEYPLDIFCRFLWNVSSYLIAQPHWI